MISSLQIIQNKLKINCTDKTIKPSKIQDTTFTSILHTNSKYNDKMNKQKKEDTQYITFGDDKEFLDFVENDINNIRFMNWKNIPLCHKFGLCKDFILNDESISKKTKVEYFDKINSKNINTIVEFDRKKGNIKYIKYNDL